MNTLEIYNHSTIMKYLVLHRFHLSTEWRVVPASSHGVSLDDANEIVAYEEKYNKHKHKHKHKHQYYIVTVPQSMGVYVDENKE